MMSIVCLQYGQCGNQLGNELYKTCFEDIKYNSNGKKLYSSYEATPKWFETDRKGDLIARAISVDTESKVVGGLEFRNKDSWSFLENNVVTSNTGGSANNWALGYYENGPMFVNKIIDRVRVTLEGCNDYAEGIINLHSAAGGTGSGVASFISQNLRDEYPKAALSSVCVLPHSYGEVTVQSYNCLLSLAKLLESLDCIFLFSNEYLNRLCTDLLNIKSVQMSDMNSVISEQLVSSLSLGSFTELLSQLNPYEQCKIVCLRSAPIVPVAMVPFESPASWNSIYKRLKMSLVKSDVTYEFKPQSKIASRGNERHYDYHKCISNVLVSRGPSYNDLQNANNVGIFDEKALYPEFLSSQPNFITMGSTKKFLKRDKFATLLSNSTLPLSDLDKIASSAWKLFTHKAYLHQYSKYGLTNKDYLDCTRTYETMLKSYREL